jgi:hypothetical protein
MVIIAVEEVALFLWCRKEQVASDSKAITVNLNSSAFFGKSF